MVQWSLDWTFSLGIHIDPIRRPWRDGLTYGPYLDLHFGPLVASFGNHPARAGDLPTLFGQGATMRPDR